MPNLKETILNEFGEEFESCWVRNIHTEVQKHLTDFLSSKLDEIEKEVKKQIPEKMRTHWKPTEQLPTDNEISYIEGYNSAIQTIREKITKYFNGISKIT